MPGVNYYDGSAFQEVAALEQSDGQTAPAYRWDGSQWVEIYPGIPDSGISRWTFDNADTSGTTAVDVWGNNDGTINGATTGASGANQTYTTNESYSFDGTDDYVDLPNLGLTNSQSFTFGAWIYPNSLTTNTNDFRQIIGRYDGTSKFLYFRIEDTSNALNFTLGDSNATLSTLQSNSEVTSDQWTHVVAKYDSGADQMEIYINGSSDISSSKNPSDFATSNGPWIGNRSDSPEEWWDGRIDDPRLYSKALTDSEVSNWYNNGSIS